MYCHFSGVNVGVIPSPFIENRPLNRVKILQRRPFLSQVLMMIYRFIGGQYDEKILSIYTYILYLCSIKLSLPSVSFKYSSRCTDRRFFIFFQLFLNAVAFSFIQTKKGVPESIFQ